MKKWVFICGLAASVGISCEVTARSAEYQIQRSDDSAALKEALPGGFGIAGNGAHR